MMALMSAPAKDRHDDAGEQQNVRIEPPSRDQAQPIDQRHGASAPRKAASGTAQATAGPRGDGDHRTQAGSAGEPQQIRLGERIPDHRLERGAAHAEAPADQEREHHARRPQIADDGRGAGVGVPEPGPDLAEREREPRRR